MRRPQAKNERLLSRGPILEHGVMKSRMHKKGCYNCTLRTLAFLCVVPSAGGEGILAAPQATKDAGLPMPGTECKISWKIYCHTIVVVT